jgi:hypothetical protein
MSNHSGGYMLNELLHGMHSLGLFANMQDDTRVNLVDKLLRTCFSHDCNWGEIIDEELAELFGVCRYCRRIRPDIKNLGYCSTCYEELKE